MPDPIKGLEEFPPMPTAPLPAAEVRRRGDRMRRRRQVVSSIAGAAAVLLIAGGGYAVTQFTHDGDSRPEVADEPPAGEELFDPLTRDNVMTDADTRLADGGPWPAGTVVDGDGQGTVNQCQRETFSALHADQVFVGTWSVEGSFLSQVVAQFADASAATRAADRVRQWLADCSPPVSEDYTVEGPEPVDAPEGVTAERVVSRWTYTGAEGGEAYADHQQVTAVVVTGNRLSVITQETPRSVEGAVDAVDTMVADAATRLMIEADRD